MPELETDYLGYRILVWAGPAEGYTGLAATVQIAVPGRGPVSGFVEVLDSIVQAQSPEWSDDDDEAKRQLAERALHRAQGAILLGRLQEIAGGTFLVPQEPIYAQRSRDRIARLVLLALERVIQLRPRGYGHETFDDWGISLLEGIDPDQMEYTLARLERAGLVEYWAMGGAERGSRLLRATDAGLLAADEFVQEQNAPGLLLEETVAKVENVLNKHRPELVESLRRQSVRVAQAREMDEHEVGEVAQACEQIIWDFLDLDVLWEDVAEERPPRDNTRDRVRLLVRSKAPSDTEQDLIEALEQYVAGWFGRLEQFIHKHRHLPQESERGHAKRFVVYTYLFLGDLIEVLGL